MLGLVDPNSSLERDFLRFLRDERLRLPDRAQHRPTRDVPVQPDFYYERKNVPGVCVFVDGPPHDAPEQQCKDSQVRARLQDRGFRVIAIRHGISLADQAREHPDVFVPET